MRVRASAVVILLVVVGASAPRAHADPALPTRAEIRREVRRLLGREVARERCTARRERGGAVVVTCRVTECPGSCQVVHAVHRIRVEAGNWRVIGTRRERRGDTGECGCCLVSE